MKQTILTSVATVGLFLTCVYAQNPTTAFQYQGHVNFGGSPANGSYDLQFSVWANASGLPQIGATFPAPATPINNGLFAVTLDFGSGVFTGPDRWLEIAIRPAGSGTYTTLTRQKITSSPYAIFAGNVNAGGLVGTVGDNQLSSNVALRAGGNTFTNTQTFNGPINLNSASGFDQSAVGNFFIDAPFIPGGRFAVLANGNVGIGVSAPSQKLQVNGAATVNGLTVNGPTTVNAQLRVFGSTEQGVVIAHASGNGVALYGDNTDAFGYAGYYNGNLAATGPITSRGPFLEVYGPDQELAYLGGDGLGTAVRVGSFSSSVTNLQFYNASSGYMNISCRTITITGGADLAEPFEISAAGSISEGAVVVIDPANPGKLKVSDQPYDRHVAGVISGANGINAGIKLQQHGALEGGKNVALTGRVFVQAETSNGPIEPGDLMTTSTLPGYAMRVIDYSRAQGAILGKAMTRLSAGQGVVLVLVSLQ